MNKWKYVFLFFAIMEIGVGIVTKLLSPQDIESIHGQVGIIQENAMFYVKSFGNGVIGLGLLSLWAFFKQNLVLWQACAAAFAVFNILATYACFSPEQQADMYISGGYGHLLFTILFTLMSIQLIRKTNPHE